jgi:acyl-CoA thioesterase
VSPRWSIGSYPNGGYILAIGLAAVRATLPHPDPFAVSAHFLSPTAHGPVDVEVEPVRAGRAHSTAAARLLQDGTERARVLATYGDLAAAQGPTVVLGSPPPLPPPEQCADQQATGPLPSGLDPEIRSRFDLRLDPATAGWFRGAPSGLGELRGWLRFADGREPDTSALPLLVDALPPAVFDLAGGGWVPTIEITVYVRGRPAPGWLTCRTATRLLIDGYLEEDAELWDSRGRLVAQSRQLARLNRRP